MSNMDCSMPGPHVPQHLLEFAQVHVHCISDAVQPSHPLMPSLPSALNLFQLQRLTWWVIYSHQMTKILELHLQHQSFQWIFRVDPLRLADLISLLSKGLSGAFSRTSILWCSAFLMVQLSQLYVTTGKTIALTIQTFVGTVMSLLFFLIIFLYCSHTV